MDIHGICPLLQVFDMPTAIRFYRDVLGFSVHATSQPGDRLQLGMAQAEWRGVDAQYGL